MTDIVDRLRHCADNCGDEYLRELSGRAADEIERLRAALRPFADALKGNWSHQPDYMTITAGPHGRDLRLELLLGHFRAARTALKEDGDE